MPNWAFGTVQASGKKENVKKIEDTINTIFFINLKT